MTNEFNTLLKTSRVNAGISQSELAKALGYSSGQFVSNWDRGISMLPVKKWKKTAKLLGIPLEDMVKASMNDFRREVKRAVGLK